MRDGFTVNIESDSGIGRSSRILHAADQFACLFRCGALVLERDLTRFSIELTVEAEIRSERFTIAKPSR